MTVSQYPSFLRQFATEGLGIAWDNMSTPIWESYQDAKAAIDGIYGTGKALATGEITVGELASAMGQSAWDGLSGDVRYLIDNYTLFDPGLKLTDEQLTELAHRSAGAYEESVQISAILYSGVEKARSIRAARQSARALRFGNNDMVYGPSAGGKLRILQEEAGASYYRILAHLIVKGIHRG